MADVEGIGFSLNVFEILRGRGQCSALNLRSEPGDAGGPAGCGVQEDTYDASAAWRVVIVKDNYDTKRLETTGGSLAMKGTVQATDAFMVRRLRDAGAIVLGKSNMAEWAFSRYVMESSIAGITRCGWDLRMTRSRRG